MDFPLPWAELDPRRHEAFDFERARKPANSALKRQRSRTSMGKRAAETDLRFLLWTALGSWIGGWCDPIASGGSNRVWTGPESVGESDEQTVARVIEALEDWNGWLVEMADAFDPIVEATKDKDDVDAVAHAAAELLPRVLERTQAKGQWARTFGRVTSWCVQACGRAEEDVSELVQRAAEAHAEPGAAPSSPQDLIDEVALEVAARDRPPFTEDALEAWWEIRGGSLWGSTEPSRGTESDAHRVYIRRHDRPRSTVRADAFTRALVRARYGAKQKLKLTPGLMREWLELALGNKDFTLRKSETTAPGGIEIYGRPKDLETRLKQALKDAIDESIPPISRAARVYMDLSVLRPYSDGNSRLARLALDYVLTRDGLGLHDGAPIFGMHHWAHDTGLPWRFQRKLASCVGKL